MLVISGKNDHYFLDDDEAYIAEINARKKGHPNYFTDVHNMLKQLKPLCQIIEQSYGLRRGDFLQGKFHSDIPKRFYEWKLIVKKVKNFDGSFAKFSDAYSRTFAERSK